MAVAIYIIDIPIPQIFKPKLSTSKYGYPIHYFLMDMRFVLGDWHS